MCTTLISKYNVSGPRYTSYPTVPYWDNDSFRLWSWKEKVQQSFEESNSNEGISLYIHSPFCESMCTFCGCNKRITKNHGLELPYIETVLQELDLYIALFNHKPVIKQLHIGGGTPTFFSVENFRVLLTGIFTRTIRDQYPEFSFEGHPNNTTKEHLQTLFDFGFERVCYGVQDYNLKVQNAINRVQPYENVLKATTQAKGAGYTSVGHDIVYGLPFQTEDDIINTIAQTIRLRPDRISFYSYAHVPWIKGNGQRGFRDEDLPTPSQKRKQYEIGKKTFKEAGYVEIGMDHFALKNDTLYSAQENGTLHRNFMGYAANKTKLMLGLGVSSISDSWYGFAQNVKNVDEYQKLVKQGIFPVYRGHILTDEDLIIRKHILSLMCQFATTFSADDLVINHIPSLIEKLKEFEKDELVTIDSNTIKVTKKGRPFVRNICMLFDLRLQRKKPETQLFSMTV
ncbi:oxygen-independent coproporphyrinogen III oxidase [Spongiivirga citrea]|uniref:Coproporphyrinogen-III oxidase n=1 Tax=Spongiivirga citrea TaxID=1481457 RepID=A0A6M0CVF9_9FLAO|nr:oxygen-independent coproporphyrinogen III oxidase [Spongiivirga citrea]NER17760.1 oxygen-independent coproporphyrinogen III oxidase [Spongiivirga citrea]